MKNIRILGFGCWNQSAIKINLIAVMVCMLGVGSSHSAPVVCAKLSPEILCTRPMSANRADWSANCGDVTVRGIGGCSSDNGAYVGIKASSLRLGQSLEENIYCWCKMTSPAVSAGWVFHSSLRSSASCASGCSTVCASHLMQTTSPAVAFRSALFSDIDD